MFSSLKVGKLQLSQLVMFISLFTERSQAIKLVKYEINY